eukprot:EG_transcript_833
MAKPLLLGLPRDGPAAPLVHSAPLWRVSSPAALALAAAALLFGGALCRAAPASQLAQAAGPLTVLPVDAVVPPPASALRQPLRRIAPPPPPSPLAGGLARPRGVTAAPTLTSLPLLPRPAAVALGAALSFACLFLAAGGRQWRAHAAGGKQSLQVRIIADGMEPEVTIVDDTLVRRREETITFAEVGGSRRAKEELQEFVDFLKNPDKYARLGAKIPKGCLITGPPGTGKTLLAKAVAGEAGVPCYIYSPNDFVEPPYSASVRIRRIFEEAKKSLAAVVFIDDLDGMSQDMAKNQLLAEMDNLAPQEVVLVLAATHRAEDLEPVALRPGRFDRKVAVQYPDVMERIEVLELEAKRLAVADNVNFKDVAAATLGFSGKDLHNLLNEAAILTVQYDMPHITQDVLTFALNRFAAGPDRKGRITTPEEKKLLAYREAGHAVAAALTMWANLPPAVSIVPYSNPPVAERFMPSVQILDSGVCTSSYLENQTVVALGGIVAEALVYADSDILTNLQADFQQVMNAAIGILQYNQTQGQRSRVNVDAETLVANAYTRARALLQSNLEAVREIAELLIEFETLPMEDCVEIVEELQTKLPSSSNTSMGQLPEYATDPTVIVEDDLPALLPALRADLRAPLMEHPNRANLLEVILDLGRQPTARFQGMAGGEPLRETKVTAEELQMAEKRLGVFGDDNRAGLPGTLHRISAIRNRHGTIVGLTCRIGRATMGRVDIIKDLLTVPTSMLFLGPPGIGKTTVLREVARQLSDVYLRRVVIVDTSNEIGGDGDIPHPAIGSSRRMQVETTALQHKVMIEAVENHMPEVVVIDEIGTVEEAAACRTIAERGVVLIATAHGRVIRNLIQNPSLCDVIGGIKSVTLSDEEATLRGTQKSILERQAPATFPLLIEMRDRNYWVIHSSEHSVDSILKGRPPTVQARQVNTDGKTVVRKCRYEEKEAAPQWRALFDDPAEADKDRGGAPAAGASASEFSGIAGQRMDRMRTPVRLARKRSSSRR